MLLAPFLLKTPSLSKYQGRSLSLRGGLISSRAAPVHLDPPDLSMMIPLHSESLDTQGRIPVYSAPLGARSYHLTWGFGDGATSTQQNPTHTYRTPGTYTVSLTVTNPWGSDIEEKTDFIVALRGKSVLWISLLLGD